MAHPLSDLNVFVHPSGTSFAGPVAERRFPEYQFPESIFGCERGPPCVRDPHLGDSDQLAAGPNPFGRDGRHTSDDQTSNNACVDAVRTQQRLRRTIAPRGHERSENAALGTRTRPLLNSISGWQG